MRTSGLILDVYDDFQGDIIKAMYPSREEIPDTVKTAHALSSDELKHLPDDVFALVLVNGDEVLRKYACTDEGNTHLSVLYFLENAHKLPEEVQKTAASNLQVACEWYGLECEELKKIAGPLGFALNEVAKRPYAAFQAAMVGPEVVHQAADNNRVIDQIRKEEGGGHRIISPDEINQRKHAEATGTTLMPISAGADPTVHSSKAVIKKTGSIGRLVSDSKGDKGISPDTNETMKHKEQPTSAPQAKVMRPHVDVTNMDNPRPSTEKKASRFALGDKYPLDSFAQVKAASVYFNEFKDRFTPEQRREYCMNLLPRAEELNIKVAFAVRRYGGDSLVPQGELKIAYDLRASHLESEEHLNMLTALFEKAAELGPELFPETLAEFDKLAGIDHLYDEAISDPYFGSLMKAAGEEFSYIEGNNMITEAELRSLARTGSRAVKTTFGEDFMVEFQKDPVGIFKSLPKDQKHMMMNMANDNSAPGVALRA